MLIQLHDGVSKRISSESLLHNRFIGINNTPEAFVCKGYTLSDDSGRNTGFNLTMRYKR